MITPTHIVSPKHDDPRYPERGTLVAVESNTILFEKDGKVETKMLTAFFARNNLEPVASASHG